MAFESLTDRLAGVFKKLRGHGKLSEAATGRLSWERLRYAHSVHWRDGYAAPPTVSPVLCP